MSVVRPKSAWTKVSRVPPPSGANWKHRVVLARSEPVNAPLLGDPCMVMIDASTRTAIASLGTLNSLGWGTGFAPVVPVLQCSGASRTLCNGVR